jgi:hypothetical protein
VPEQRVTGWATGGSRLYGDARTAGSDMRTPVTCVMPDMRGFSILHLNHSLSTCTTFSPLQNILYFFYLTSSTSPRHHHHHYRQLSPSQLPLLPICAHLPTKTLRLPRAPSTRPFPTRATTLRSSHPRQPCPYQHRRRSINALWLRSQTLLGTCLGAIILHRFQPPELPPDLT